VLVRRETLDPIDFEGLKILDYTGEAELGSSFATIEVPAGGSHAEAWSKRSDKYYFVQRGAIRFVLQGDEVELREGDFCFVRRGERFSYRNDSPETAIVVLVHTPAFRLESEIFTDSELSR
jgi:mannose-6-phosphate isomerase-like protein (cupin superfamily)